MIPSDVKATLSFSDGSPPMDLPVYKGTIGPDVIDIRKLYGQTGKFTYDPGFLSTASCQSTITYIDGDKGELLYRGYPIDNLAQNADFLETCFLLLKGELPNAQEKEEFVKTVTNHTMVHEQMQFFFRGFRRDAHPMAILVAAVGAPSLLPACLLAAVVATVAVSAVAVRADEENRVAALTKASPLSQNRFAMNHRHASSQAGLDNGSGLVAG